MGQRELVSGGLLKDGEVLDAAGEDPVQPERIQVHAGRMFDGFHAKPGRNGPPLLGSVVRKEALDGVPGVGGPVDQADPLLGEEAVDLVVLDDQGAPGDAGALAEQCVGVGLVVEHIGDDDDVKGVVVEGEAAAGIGGDGDGLAAAGVALEALGPDAGGASGMACDGGAEQAGAAPDIEQAVVGADVREDALDQDALARGVDRFVECSEQCAHGYPGVDRISASVR